MQMAGMNFQTRSSTAPPGAALYN
ncbi:DUF6783 domain-containing protein [uncultured Robinsoniella sp.]